MTVSETDPLDRDFAFFGFKPRMEDRTVEELQIANVYVNKTKRASLDEKSLRKLQEKAEAGLDHKFKLLHSEEGTAILTVYSICIRIAELERQVKHTDTGDVFTIYTMGRQTLTFPQKSLHQLCQYSCCRRPRYSKILQFTWQRLPRSEQRLDAYQDFQLSDGRSEGASLGQTWQHC